MKTSPILLSALAFSFALSLHAEPRDSVRNTTETPPASQLSQSLFWIADSRKMDAFLAHVSMDEIRAGAYAEEVLPDTRAAWRHYAREAGALACDGHNAEAAGRLGQMLKLAAVYRAFGGLQNVVQGEEIRHLAGLTAEKLGKPVTDLIQSPYLEKDAADCLLAIEAKVGEEKKQVTSAFWHHFEIEAVNSHYRLSGNGSEMTANR